MSPTFHSTLRAQFHPTKGVLRFILCGLTVLSGLLLASNASALPSLQILDGTCTNPKTDFNVGDTVCVKSTNTVATNKIEWFDYCFDAAIKTTTVAGNPQTDTLTLPASGQTTGGGNCDTRGDWQVEEFTAAQNFQAQAAFRVHDPAHAAADLQITGSGNTTQPNVDNAIFFS